MSKIELSSAGSIIANYRAAYLRKYGSDCTLSDQAILDILNNPDSAGYATVEEDEEVTLEMMHEASKK